MCASHSSCQKTPASRDPSRRGRSADRDLLELSDVRAQLAVASRISIRFKQERDNVRVRLCAQRSDRPLRHRRTSALEQRRDRPAVVQPQECLASQRRRGVLPREVSQMTRRTRTLILRCAARGVRPCVHALRRACADGELGDDPRVILADLGHRPALRHRDRRRSTRSDWPGRPRAILRDDRVCERASVAPRHRRARRDRRPRGIHRVL